MVKELKSGAFRGRSYGRRVAFQLLYQEDLNPGAQERFSEDFIYNELYQLCHGGLDLISNSNISPSTNSDEVGDAENLDEMAKPETKEDSELLLDEPVNTELAEAVSISYNQLKELVKFVRRLFHRTLENRDEIDRMLESVSKNWSLVRMAKTERNILRLAVGDMLYMKTPKAVAIHEALELGKLFGEKGTTAFLNGILDRIDLTQTSTVEESKQ